MIEALDSYYEVKRENLFGKLEHQLISLGGVTIDYYVHQKEKRKTFMPKLLLVSGLHGNEAEVIDPLINYLDNNLKELPDLVFIPYASPSANSLKTEKNAEGHNINRKFLRSAKQEDENPEDFEAEVLMRIIEQFSFEITTSFHQDYDRVARDTPKYEPPGYYLYSIGSKAQIDMTRLKREAQKIGVVPFNGLDDTDPIHRNLVEEGYVNPGLKIGLLEDWTVIQHLANLAFVFETPFNLTYLQKYALIKAYFKNIIIPGISD